MNAFVTMLYIKKWHNAVNQLYPNKKIKIKGGQADCQ